MASSTNPGDSAARSAPSGHYFQASSTASFQPMTVELLGEQRNLVAAKGIFSPKEIDKGTAILLRHVKAPSAAGTFLDLGCGWGPLALTMGLAQPEAEVWALDVNENALASTAENARRLGLTNIRPITAEQIPGEVGFDQIWSNPPIRVGKKVLHQLLLAWLPRLNPGGQAWLVVQKHLGSDSLLKWLQQELPAGFVSSRAASDKGFRILLVEREQQR
ncbi:class I SAM-dependent methyltransferase [Micrococcoides hystricis]|uniref:Class I SAM-dependent methyltransferase n=1 Tax=Micrococcoides hystricis TaxID=1572761 RepID=A0ABV6P9F8_9MICC